MQKLIINKNCPFCGNDILQIASDALQNYVVLCEMCKAQGPFCKNRTKAIKAWDERFNNLTSYSDVYNDRESNLRQNQY